MWPNPHPGANAPQIAILSELMATNVQAALAARPQHWNARAVAARRKTFAAAEHT